MSKVKFKELIEGRITPLASNVSKVARLAAIWANRFGIVGNDSSLAIDANQAARRRPRVESGSVSKVTRSDAEKCPRITCFKDTTVSKPHEKSMGNRADPSFLRTFPLSSSYSFASSPISLQLDGFDRVPVLLNNGRYRPVAICRLSVPWKMSCDNGGFRLFATSHRKKKGEDRGCRTSADPSAFWQSFLFSSLSGTKPRLLNGRWPSAFFFRLRYASARVIAAVFLRDARRGKDCEFFTRSFNCILLHTLVYWGIGRDRFRFPLHLETGVDRSDRAPPRIYVRIIYFTCWENGGGCRGCWQI